MEMRCRRRRWRRGRKRLVRLVKVKSGQLFGKGVEFNRVRSIRTLSTDTSVPQDADFLADLVMNVLHVLGDAAPLVLLLVFICICVFARGDEPIHDGPFGDRRSVDAGAGGDRDGCFSEDRMVEGMV